MTFWEELCSTPAPPPNPSRPGAVFDDPIEAQVFASERRRAGSPAESYAYDASGKTIVFWWPS